MGSTRECLKCRGLQVYQTVSEDLTIHQYRCLNCGRIDEPGLVVNTRRIVYDRLGKYSDASAATIRRRQLERAREAGRRRSGR